MTTPTIVMLVGLALVWLGVEYIVRRDKALTRGTHQRVVNAIEAMRAAGTEEIDKLRHEAEIEWAMEQSQYEVKH